MAQPQPPVPPPVHSAPSSIFGALVTENNGLPCELCKIPRCPVVGIIPRAEPHIWGDVAAWSPTLDFLHTDQGRHGEGTTINLCWNHVVTYRAYYWTLGLDLNCLVQLIQHEVLDMQNRVDQLEAGEKDPGRTFPEIDARYVYMTTLPYMHSWAYLNPLPDGQLVPPLPPGRNISIAPWTDLSKIQASGMWQLFLMRSSLAFVAGTVSPSDMVRFGEGTPRAWRRINACTRYLVGMYKRTPEFYVRNPHVQFMEAEFEEYFATMLQQLNAPQPPDQQPEDQEMPEEAPPQHDAPIQDHSALFASALESAGAMDKFRIAGCNRRDLKVKALDWEGGGRLGAADIAEPIATPEVLGKRPRTTGPFGSGSCRYRFATSANFIYDPRTCA